MSPTRMRPVIKSTKKYQAPLRCQGKETRLTLDDREEELGLSEVSDAEDVDDANGEANNNVVAPGVRGIVIPERYEDLSGGDFDRTGDLTISMAVAWSAALRAYIVMAWA